MILQAFFDEWSGNWGMFWILWVIFIITYWVALRLVEEDRKIEDAAKEIEVD